MDGVTELPMFPLGSVLFPHAVLPLHVFEPRYRTLVDDVLAADGRFGVVLIERGHEVGGGDVRFGVGTVAEIVQAGRFPDGRVALATVGVERFEIVEWLADDPYPRASVVPRPEPEPTLGPAAAEALLAGVRDRLARVHELRAALGMPAFAGEVVVSADLVRASYEAACLAPLGALDAQSLLELDEATDRLAALGRALDAEIEVCTFRLGA